MLHIEVNSVKNGALKEEEELLAEKNKHSIYPSLINTSQT